MLSSLMSLPNYRCCNITIVYSNLNLVLDQQGQHYNQQYGQFYGNAGNQSYKNKTNMDDKSQPPPSYSDVVKWNTFFCWSSFISWNHQVEFCERFDADSKIRIPLHEVVFKLFGNILKCFSDYMCVPWDIGFVP